VQYEVQYELQLKDFLLQWLHPHIMNPGAAGQE
jgi:hypothetical protein